MTIRIAETLTLPLDVAQLATVVYGARGSGKTSLGRVIAEEVSRAGIRFCAIDLKGDWWGLKSSADGKRDGLPVVVFGGDHADVPLEPDSGSFVGETVAALAQSTILDFELLSKGKQMRFLGQFFETLYHHNRDPLVILADESQRYAPQKPGPDEARTLGAVQDLVKLGRKHGLGVVLFTQRGAGLNKEVSELCDLLVAFRTPGPLDQGRIQDWLDANTTKAERELVMGKLAGLATGTAVFASGHPDLKLFGVHGVRRPSTFDSSATPKIGERRVEPKRLAQPDLDELRTKMAAAIERAKADDPKTLKARIAELERQIAKGGAAPERVEVPMFDEARFNLLFDGLSGQIDAITSLATATKTELGRALVQYRDECRRAVKAAPKITPAPMQRSLAPEPPKRPLASPSRNGGNVSLSLIERALLTAYVQHGRLSLVQAAIIAGYSTNSGSTAAAAGKLRASGLIDGGNASAVATSAGAAECIDVPALPTGPALAKIWFGKLSPIEGAILKQAIEAYPEPVSLHDAATAANYSTNSGSTAAAAGKLRTLQLVHGGNAGMTADERLVD